MSEDTDELINADYDQMLEWVVEPHLKLEHFKKACDTKLSMDLNNRLGELNHTLLQISHQLKLLIEK